MKFNFNALHYYNPEFNKELINLRKYKDNSEKLIKKLVGDRNNTQIIFNQYELELPAYQFTNEIKFTYESYLYTLKINKHLEYDAPLRTVEEYCNTNFIETWHIYNSWTNTGYDYFESYCSFNPAFMIFDGIETDNTEDYNSFLIIYNEFVNDLPKYIVFEYIGDPDYLTLCLTSCYIYIHDTIYIDLMDEEYYMFAEGDPEEICIGNKQDLISMLQKAYESDSETFNQNVEFAEFQY